MNKKVMEHFKDFVWYLWEFQSPESITNDVKIKIIHAVIWACIDEWTSIDKKINTSIVELVNNFDKYYKDVLNEYNKKIDMILSWKMDSKAYNNKQKKTDMIKLEWFAMEWKRKLKDILEQSKKAI